jgi:hypothetical protein
MSGVILDSGDVYCLDHAIDDLEWLLEEGEYVNNPRKALTFDADLESIGFEQFNGQYENGWHPGQDDKPEDALERARAAGWSEGVFVINETGQFDIGFQLWVRNTETEED